MEIGVSDINKRWVRAIVAGPMWRVTMEHIPKFDPLGGN